MPGHVCVYRHLKTHDYANFNLIFLLIWPLDEFQGPLHLDGHSVKHPLVGADS